MVEGPEATRERESQRTPASGAGMRSDERANGERNDAVEPPAERANKTTAERANRTTNEDKEKLTEEDISTEQCGGMPGQRGQPPTPANAPATQTNAEKAHKREHMDVEPTGTTHYDGEITKDIWNQNLIPDPEYESDQTDDELSMVEETYQVPIWIDLKKTAWHTNGDP